MLMQSQESMSDSEYLEQICEFVKRHYHTYRERIRTSVHKPAVLMSRWKAVVNTMREAHPNLFKSQFDNVFKLDPQENRARLS